jgi:hypothetical protein
VVDGARRALEDEVTEDSLSEKTCRSTPAACIPLQIPTLEELERAIPRENNV